MQLNPKILSQDQKEIKKLPKYLVFFALIFVDMDMTDDNAQDLQRKIIIIGPQKTYVNVH